MLMFVIIITMVTVQTKRSVISVCQLTEYSDASFSVEMVQTYHTLERARFDTILLLLRLDAVLRRMHLTERQKKELNKLLIGEQIPIGVL